MLAKILALIMIFGLTFETKFDINILMDLFNKIDQTKYAGILVLGDVHARYDAFLRGVTYAKSNGMFLISLGDLIDHGEQPYECVALMDMMLHSGDAAFVVGNHEDKYVRYAKNKGRESFKKGQQQTQMRTSHLRTLFDVGEERETAFLQLIADIVNHPMSDNQLVYGNVVFAHGGVHANSWGGEQVELNQRDKHRSYSLGMYGETDGVSRDDEGFPVRTYVWTDAIPAERYAVVGHDAFAMGKKKTSTHIHKNEAGGNTIFLDTHSGKGGILSGAVFTFTPDGLEFSVIVSFN